MKKKCMNAVEAVKDQIRRRDEVQAKLDRLSLVLAEAMEKEGFSVGSINITLDGDRMVRQIMRITVCSPRLIRNSEAEWPV